MTCCLGLEHEGRVWLAWDSASTDETYAQSIPCEPKGWTVNGWGFAFAGSWRLGQLLRHELTPPRVTASRLERYVQVDLVREMRSILRDEVESEFKDAELLIARHGHLYAIGLATYYALRARCGYAAIGSAEGNVGLELTRGRANPDRRLRGVLDAVAMHCANVRAPFTIVQV